MDLKQMATMMMRLSPTERAQIMNNNLSGFDAAVDLRFVTVDPERVVATMEAGHKHTQPYGLVHGGVYATLGESVCSVGAAMSVMASGQNAVGAENTTRFLRGTRPGTTLTIDARPLPERSTERRRVWEAVMTNDAGERCATSRVTIAVLEPGKKIAGSVVGLLDGDDRG